MKNTLLLSALALLFGACQQSPDDQPDQTALLTGSRWELSSYEYRFEPHADSLGGCLAFEYSAAHGEMRNTMYCDPQTRTIPGYRLHLRFTTGTDGEGIYEVEEAVAYTSEIYSYCEADSIEIGTWLYGSSADRLNLNRVTVPRAGLVGQFYLGSNARGDSDGLRQDSQLYQIMSLTEDRLELQARNANQRGEYNIRAVFTATNTDLCD